MKFLATGIFLLFVVLSPVPGPMADSTRTEKIIIVSDGRYMTFDVEVSSTRKARKKGLMYRQAIPSKTGMLFDYGETRKVAMWMKNTYVSLDIIFIDKNGVIANIAHNTTPLSLTPIPSDGPVLGVLEVMAGTAHTMKLKKGDKILHRIFTQSK